LQREDWLSLFISDDFSQLSLAVMCIDTKSLQVAKQLNKLRRSAKIRLLVTLKV